MIGTERRTDVISRVRSVGIYCRDQDEAKEFWTGKIGFELLQDEPMGQEPGSARWIEVRPPADDTVLVLFTPPDQEDLIGRFSNVIFSCPDIKAAYEALKAKGVEFTVEPKMESWGSWWAQFRDPDGNEYGLGQDEARQ
jgi:catechol 2,3-dioxygenase-like lactoylglutathione lyase family enzyme